MELNKTLEDIRANTVKDYCVCVWRNKLCYF